MKESAILYGGLMIPSLALPCLLEKMSSSLLFFHLFRVISFSFTSFASFLFGGHRLSSVWLSLAHNKVKQCESWQSEAQCSKVLAVWLCSAQILEWVQTSAWFLKFKIGSHSRVLLDFFHFSPLCRVRPLCKSHDMYLPAGPKRSKF